MTTTPKYYCPFCSSQKHLWKSGFRATWNGGRIQQYKCRVCSRQTVRPRKSKPRRKE